MEENERREVKGEESMRKEKRGREKRKKITFAQKRSIPASIRRGTSKTTTYKKEIIEK